LTFLIPHSSGPSIIKDEIGKFPGRDITIKFHGKKILEFTNIGLCRLENLKGVRALQAEKVLSSPRRQLLTAPRMLDTMSLSCHKDSSQRQNQGSR
jgi:hypothetical protein